MQPFDILLWAGLSPGLLFLTVAVVSGRWIGVADTAAEKLGFLGSSGAMTAAAEAFGGPAAAALTLLGIIVAGYRQIAYAWSAPLAFGLVTAVLGLVGRSIATPWLAAAALALFAFAAVCVHRDERPLAGGVVIAGAIACAVGALSLPAAPVFVTAEVAVFAGLAAYDRVVRRAVLVKETVTPPRWRVLVAEAGAALAWSAAAVTVITAVLWLATGADAPAWPGLAMLDGWAFAWFLVATVLLTMAACWGDHEPALPADVALVFTLIGLVQIAPPWIAVLACLAAVAVVREWCEHRRALPETSVALTLLKAFTVVHLIVTATVAFSYLWG